MDIKKILKHIDGVEGKQKRHQQLNEAASMVINGDHADDVGIILDRLRGISTPSATTQAPNMRNDMDKFISAMGPREPSMMDIEPDDADMGGMPALPGEMPGGSIGGKHTGNEEWANEPDEDYRDTEFMTKDLSGGINGQKKMYKPAAKGDNPMAVESIKARLLRALDEAMSKPDFLDMDKDGDKKEPMKKAVADKKKKVKEAAKPDFLDMDKDGNKKEPMKKAVADKKNKQVGERFDDFDDFDDAWLNQPERDEPRPVWMDKPNLRKGPGAKWKQGLDNTGQRYQDDGTQGGYDVDITKEPQFRDTGDTLGRSTRQSNALNKKTQIQYDLDNKYPSLKRKLAAKLPENQKATTDKKKNKN